MSTRGRSIRLAPQHDGLTNAEIVGSYDGNGMRVEVHLGLDVGKVDLSWAHVARRLAKGDYYKGKTSAYWYTTSDFHELCLAALGLHVRLDTILASRGLFVFNFCYCKSSPRRQS